MELSHLLKDVSQKAPECCDGCGVKSEDDKERLDRLEIEQNKLLCKLKRIELEAYKLETLGILSADSCLTGGLFYGWGAARRVAVEGFGNVPPNHSGRRRLGAQKNMPLGFCTEFHENVFFTLSSLTSPLLAPTNGIEEKDSTNECVTPERCSAVEENNKQACQPPTPSTADSPTERRCKVTRKRPKHSKESTQRLSSLPTPKQKFRQRNSTGRFVKTTAIAAAATANQRPIGQSNRTSSFELSIVEQNRGDDSSATSDAKLGKTGKEVGIGDISDRKESETNAASDSVIPSKDTGVEGEGVANKWKHEGEPMKIEPILFSIDACEEKVDIFDDNDDIKDEDEVLEFEVEKTDSPSSTTTDTADPISLHLESGNAAQESNELVVTEKRAKVAGSKSEEPGSSNGEDFSVCEPVHSSPFEGSEERDSNGIGEDIAAEKAKVEVKVACNEDGDSFDGSNGKTTKCILNNVKQKRRRKTAERPRRNCVSATGGGAEAHKSEVDDFKESDCLHKEHTSSNDISNVEGKDSSAKVDCVDDMDGRQCEASESKELVKVLDESELKCKLDTASLAEEVNTRKQNKVVEIISGRRPRRRMLKRKLQSNKKNENLEVSSPPETDTRIDSSESECEGGDAAELCESDNDKNNSAVESQRHMSTSSDSVPSNQSSEESNSNFSGSRRRRRNACRLLPRTDGSRARTRNVKSVPKRKEQKRREQGISGSPQSNGEHTRRAIRRTRKRHCSRV